MKYMTLIFERIPTMHHLDLIFVVSLVDLNVVWFYIFIPSSKYSNLENPFFLNILGKDFKKPELSKPSRNESNESSINQRSLRCASIKQRSGRENHQLDLAVVVIRASSKKGYTFI